MKLIIFLLTCFLSVISIAEEVQENLFEEEKLSNSTIENYNSVFPSYAEKDLIIEGFLEAFKNTNYSVGYGAEDVPVYEALKNLVNMKETEASFFCSKKVKLIECRISFSNDYVQGYGIESYDNEPREFYFIISGMLKFDYSGPNRAIVNPKSLSFNAPQKL